MSVYPYRLSPPPPKCSTLLGPPLSLTHSMSYFYPRQMLMPVTQPSFHHHPCHRHLHTPSFSHTHTHTHLHLDSEAGESDGTTQDILTCGSCQKTFALSDIVRFIQHKVFQCNKENYGQCFTQGKQRAGRPPGRTHVQPVCPSKTPSGFFPLFCFG